MICYKVVRRISRYSTSLGNRSKKYNRKYLKGSIIESVPDSLGIFVFDTLENARRFSRNSWHNCEILKVKGINKKSVPVVAALIGFNDKSKDSTLDRFYKSESDDSYNIPVGTLLFEKVEVLT